MQMTPQDRYKGEDPDAPVWEFIYDYGEDEDLKGSVRAWTEDEARDIISSWGYRFKKFIKVPQ